MQWIWSQSESKTKIKWAEELIAILTKRAGKEKVERMEEDFRLPALSLTKLLDKGLVKETAKMSALASEEGIEKMEEVAVADETMEKVVIEKELTKKGRVFLKRKDRKR